MFDYKYDEESGGIILVDKQVSLSNEPRPVYANELDLLGLDSIYSYDKQNEVPYMWAEKHRYYYRGKNIFITKGGTLYEKPSIEIVYREDEDGNKVPNLAEGSELITIDIDSMVKKNADLINVLEKVTLKKIFNVYKKYKDKIDCFHVAFSGGKDSIVLLELVKTALPKSSYMVIFSDTKMEFPDTYKLVDKIEEKCKEEGIEFYRASTHFEPEESWKLFGPPSRVLRWCCTVHKAAPQTLMIREILGKKDYVGLDYVGVRAYESATRAGYDEENYGKKQKGQYSHNAILDWTSAEIWLYIYSRNLLINETYKKGNSRAGCLFCPMGGGKSDTFRNLNYSQEISKYTELIKESIIDNNIDTYITNGGWIERKNGRDIKNNLLKYSEEVAGGKLIITVNNPKTDWKEWIKTIGEISFDYDVEETSYGYVVTAPAKIDKSTQGKYFKQVFHKSAACVGCRVCEMNCKNGCISFSEGLRIDNCIHCKQCHEIDDGCLVYHSMTLPKNGGKTTMKGSINSFADHAPKIEWLQDFYSKGKEFFNDNMLGPMQITNFKKFLTHSGLVKGNDTTLFYDLTTKLGMNSESAWGLIYINLVYENPEFRWYLDNMNLDETYTNEYLIDKLIEAGLSKKDGASVIKAFSRFSEIPLGTVVHFGEIEKSGRSIKYVTRTKMNISDDRVLLYALYRYAKACDNYYEFSLHTLMDMTVQSVGISPVKIFGFTRDEMEAMLRGLSAKYPDYIDATFTYDLDKITLRDYHTAEDVFKLYEE